MRILAINPGSTSTKIAVYEGKEPVFKKSIAHSTEQLAPFANAFEQLDFRREVILDTLRQGDIPLEFDAVVARGPLSKPVEGGVYAVDDDMVTLARNCTHVHACDLGCILARDIARETGNPPAMIADPGVVDELNPYARISGSPLMPRIAIWHALNQRAIARRHAENVGKRYEDLNLIVCHMGGGISVAAHEKGRAVDANNALDGEGPFSPERAGSLPAHDLIHLCFSGEFTEAQLLKRIAGKAGLTAHLGTNDLIEIERRIEEGDDHARLILDAMIYHIAKNIAAQGAVLCGNVDAILLTGGMARSSYIIPRLEERISWIAPVVVYPGEDELEALALNALGVLQGTIEPKKY